MKTYCLILTICVLGLALGAWAQSSPAPSAAPNANAQPVGPTAPQPATTIQQRKTDQQDRIANGLDSGQLTAGETRNLETQESDLNKEEHDMRKLDDGHLTSADRQTLNQQQNQLSKQIYQDKHNAATAAQPGSELNDRRVDQRDRIANGIRSGQLTAGETAHLENREVQTNRTEAAMKAADGGKLTAGDRAQLNRQFNHTSRAIYRDKRNGRVR